MGKLKQKGKAGAAVNYINRNKALKKLQISLADFRYITDIFRHIKKKKLNHIVSF
jgi:hypothetical protein